jgi:amidohydrolase
MASAGSAVTAVLQGLQGMRTRLEDYYRDLHAHLELSHEEHRTAASVAQWLTAAGYETHAGVGGTGVVGVLRNGAGPTVLLRADMDALPVLERTGLPYASVDTATDAAGAQVPVMHACGHDVHVTCLLGAAELLANARDQWSGTLVALFQPAEEVGDGARGMVEDGLAGLVPKPDVALAQHVLAFPAGEVGFCSGQFLSAANTSGSPSTAAARTGPCPRPPSTPSCSPR